MSKNDIVLVCGIAGCIVCGSVVLLCLDKAIKEHPEVIKIITNEIKGEQNNG